MRRHRDLDPEPRLIPADTKDLASRLEAEALRIGFDAVGIARLRPSDHAELYRDWLARQYHGDMHYLARPDAVARRTNPGQELLSAIVVALHYDPTTYPADSEPANGIIARYARGRDYHRVIKARLLELLRWLEAETGRQLPRARASVDTAPVLERELARRAGLGWFGRNTMLIHPRRGSYFFLGTLLVDIELEPSESFERDHCGSCRACLDACPTGALLGRDANGAPIMDARRCISYLTIEHRGSIPVELRPLMGNRVFGCDICQEVCPFNNDRFVPLTKEQAFLPRSADSDRGNAPRAKAGPSTAAPSLVQLMRMTRDEWDVWTRGSAIRRAGYAGFKRNVAVALGNWLACVDEAPEDAMTALRSALEDEDPLVREHAAWALDQTSE